MCVPLMLYHGGCITPMTGCMQSRHTAGLSQHTDLTQCCYGSRYLAPLILQAKLLQRTLGRSVLWWQLRPSTVHTHDRYTCMCIKQTLLCRLTDSLEQAIAARTTGRMGIFLLRVSALDCVINLQDSVCKQQQERGYGLCMAAIYPQRASNILLRMAVHGSVRAV